ncbi:hypothetical protein TcCL_ESM01482 [Trypanosoma cruzi]|nr:hypothetical protein TcCL_ESM01482 [Trypanosoma cruzi]
MRASTGPPPGLLHVAPASSYEACGVCTMNIWAAVHVGQRSRTPQHASQYSACVDNKLAVTDGAHSGTRISSRRLNIASGSLKYFGNAEGNEGKKKGEKTNRDRKKGKTAHDSGEMSR